MALNVGSFGAAIVGAVIFSLGLPWGLWQGCYQSGTSEGASRSHHL